MRLGCATRVHTEPVQLELLRIEWPPADFTEVSPKMLMAFGQRKLLRRVSQHVRDRAMALIMAAL